MKKTYTTPVVEKIKFEYKDQVVVASGMRCNPIVGETHEDTDNDGHCDKGYTGIDGGYAN